MFKWFRFIVQAPSFISPSVYNLCQLAFVSTMAASALNNFSLRVSQANSKLDEAFRAMDAGVHIDDDELHRLAMECQGTEESEFCFGDESSLHKYCKTCEKNPGHENFILLDDLSLDHFPEELRHPECFDLIRCQAALTVKLTMYFKGVKPEFFPMKAKSFSRLATGFVLSATPIGIMEKGKEGGQGSSPKPENFSSDHPQDEVFKLHILTATHVVFEEVEAKEVKIDYSYYDSCNRKKVKSDKVTMDHLDFGEDFSIVTHYIKDKELYLKLQTCIDQIHHEFNVTKRNPPSEWVPIVSHPHGRDKHVSFGKIRTKDSQVELGSVSGPTFPWLDEFPPICYTTDTCPGSSGARVFLWSLQKRLIIYSHRGEGNGTYNVSARGFRYHDLLEWFKTGLRPIKPHDFNDMFHP